MVSCVTFKASTRDLVHTRARGLHGLRAALGQRHLISMQALPRSMQDALLACIVNVSTQALLQVLTSDAAGCRGFTVAPAGSTLLAAAPAAPFSFGLPPVLLQKPVSTLLDYLRHHHHGR